MTPNQSKIVDQSALKVNQVVIISLLSIAFIIDSHWLVLIIGIIMLVGTALPSLALFKQIYKRLLAPAKIVKPVMIEDNPAPHRFAQGFGGVAVMLGTIALFIGQIIMGWTIVALVIILAAMNLFLGFCAGCFIYYQLNRLGVPGFTASKINRA